MKKRNIVLALVVSLVGTATAVSAQTIEDQGEIYLTNPSALYQHAFSSDMPGGRRYEVQHSEGLLITENLESPLYLTSILHRTGRLVEQDEITGEEKLLFRWIMMDATDREGNQIFFWGEHNPPAAPHIRITEGTGKYDGIRGSLNMGWEPAARYPDGPEGSIKLEYDIQFDMSADDPNQHQPIHGRTVPDEVIVKEWSRMEVLVTKTENREVIELPNGNIYGRGDELGFTFTEDKDHPMYGMHVSGPNIAIMGPEQRAKRDRGELRMEECCIYQLGLMVLTDARGDQIYVVLENRPGIGVTWHGVKGTGQFEDVTLYGRASLYGRPFQEDVFFVKESLETHSYADTPGRAWPTGQFLDLSYYQFEYADQKTN